MKIFQRKMNQLFFIEKSIYLLQDTERIGLFVQLINQALATLTHVF